MNNCPKSCSLNPLTRWPWLFVVLAFVVLIGSWIATIKISGSIPNRRLSPAEEQAVLAKKVQDP
jgi:uncharacterized membrane protein YdfJ with MMPL/SSD domain